MGVNRAGFVIHSALHMAKPDVNCVIHTHTWAGMAVSTMECGLLPNTQTSMRFARISYHDFDGVVIPGGYAPDMMRRYPAMLKLVKDCADLKGVKQVLLSYSHDEGYAVAQAVLVG